MVLQAPPAEEEPQEGLEVPAVAEVGTALLAIHLEVWAVEAVVVMVAEEAAESALGYNDNCKSTAHQGGRTRPPSGATAEQ